VTQRGAIIGGGIAGLAVGLYAQRHSLSLPILEKSSALPCADNLLWIAPNGLHLLADLELIEPLRHLFVAQRAMLFSDANLRDLTSLDCLKLTKTNGYPIVAVKRADLYDLMLRRFLSQGGEVLYGQNLTAINQIDAKVFLNIQGQSIPSVYDYGIAADGIGSMVRRQLFPQSEVHYQGICTYLGRSMTPVAQRYVGRTIEAWGVGTRFMLTSLDGVSVYWSAMERPEFYQKNAAAIEPQCLGRLQDLFSNYHPDVVDILGNAVESSLQRCNFGVVRGVPSYAALRIGLLGDAAHGMPPNMGQGASLALEDAFCLVQAIVQSQTVEQAFIQYDRLRRPRAKQMVQIANSMNTTFQPKGRMASSLRDLAAAVFPASLSQRRMAHLYKVPFPLSKV